MNWEAAGAIGEVLGAAAVVVTLLYLAKQTKTNSQLIEMQAGRQVSYHLSNLYNEWARDPETMRVLNKSMENPMADYTPEEWAQLNFLLKSYFHAIEAQYVSHKSGLGLKEQDDGYLRAARTTLATWPAWKKTWEGEAANGVWPPGFVEEMSRDDVGNLDSFNAPDKAAD